MSKQGCVYILGNQKPVYYIGSTSNLVKRIKKHRSGYGSGFTRKYRTYKLLYLNLLEKGCPLIDEKDSSKIGIVIGKQI